MIAVPPTPRSLHLLKSRFPVCDVVPTSTPQALVATDEEIVMVNEPHTTVIASRP
jgi:hypothetical protein